MIFYFSGNPPFTRRDWPDDEDMQFFKKHDMPYDRLVCLIYEKEANLVINNKKLMESSNGRSTQARTDRRS